MNPGQPSTPALAPPVWLITGCSSGFGLELATQALARGHQVAVTARNVDQIRALAGHSRAMILPLDVTDAAQVDAAVSATMNRFGKIDVLVNNAGIGYFAAVEESEPAAIARLFDINVFGMGRMIRAVLPGMRQRRTGCIVNMSSAGGLRAMPALGYYCATKFAVEGLSGALREELKPLGIDVMVVEPSGFRTDWAGRSAGESKTQIADYAATAGATRVALRAVSGRQRGDPARAAGAMLDAIAAGHPPAHLLLGNDAFDGAMAQLDALRAQFAAVETIARAADFPAR
ncbi:oxidoreductase [Massilia sp. S19_KUP03_FR1]|uniref:oxidoreductase n=1 Tax=Massilia sp. S19_KUP03_FR1 TaxID=3025503 RepID=UPI002FCDD020